jgi:hypothetical protein
VGGKDNRTRTAKSRPYRSVSADASLCLSHTHAFVVRS